MPNIESLDLLFAAAGRAVAREHEARKRRKRQEKLCRRADELAYAEAKARARITARDVFAWVDGADGRALRAKLREAGLEALPITPWLSSRGEPRQGPCSGAWRVSLTARGRLEVLNVGIIGAGGMGGFRRRADTARDLRRLASPWVTIVVAADVKGGGVMAHVGDALQAIVRARPE